MAIDFKKTIYGHIFLVTGISDLKNIIRANDCFDEPKNKVKIKIRFLC